MLMNFVMLWTDFLVYLLLILAILCGLQIIHKPYLRELWRHVIYRPINLTACFVLIGFSIIALLDTIHFRIDLQQESAGVGGIVSVLDKILAPIAVHHERTYSAPFATHSFTKEAMISPKGEIYRDFPRLQFGGAHLANTNEKWPDIKQRLLKLSLVASILWLVLCSMLTSLGAARRKIPMITFLKRLITGQLAFPWRTLMILLGITLWLGIFIENFMSFYHILGTTQVGEDVLYITLKSIRTGLVIGTVTTLLTLPFAILFGIMAGFFRGWIDDVIQYIYTTLSSIPAVLLIAAAVLMLDIVMGRHNEWFQTVVDRSDARLLALCAILGITSWTGLCRLLRGEALKIGQMDYVQASRSLGASDFRIIYKHILPNVFHIILITIALDFSGLVLAEAVLSYVGVGVDPASYSWGLMINSARLEMARDPIIWWNLTAAFIFMFALVLSANVFSDALRDAFDPQARLLGVK